MMAHSGWAPVTPWHVTGGSERPRRPCHIFWGRTCDVRHATCASDITTFRLAAVACRIVESRSRMSRVARRTSKTTIPPPARGPPVRQRWRSRHSRNGRDANASGKRIPVASAQKLSPFVFKHWQIPVSLKVSNASKKLLFHLGQRTFALKPKGYPFKGTGKVCDLKDS